MKTLFAAAALAVALPASAQEASADWDLMREPDKKLTIAFLAFDNGLSIGARCMNNSFQVLISGLPPATGTTRTLKVAFQEEAFQDQSWNVAETPSVAISDLPSPLARDIREGGKMQIIVVGGAEGGRNLRYVLDLPASSGAVDEALQACGRPLVDPRDAELKALGDDGLPLDIEWARQPRPEYPSGRTYTRGFATVTCITSPNGALRDCVVETEHPLDGGFGAEVLYATRSARVRNKQDGSVPPGMISFRTNFSMEETTMGGGGRIRSH